MDRLSVGQNIRKVREAKGYSGKDLAEMTGLSAAAISKFERGLLRPNESFVEKVIEALELVGNEAFALRELTTFVNSQFNRWTLNSTEITNNQVNHAQREKNCLQFRTFSNHVMPGLIQCPEYMRAIFSLLVQDNKQGIQKMIQSRMARQKILSQKKRSFHFVLSEGALRTSFQSQETRKKQIEHLIRLIDKTPSVEIRVLPFAKPLNRFVLDSFSIYDKRTVNIETLKGEIDLWTNEDVSYYDETMNYLLEAALSSQQSGDFLRRLLKEI